MIALRASSLAAVTIFVWSTSPKPSVTARSRTAWRIRTMSSDRRSGIASACMTVEAAAPNPGERKAPVLGGRSSTARRDFLPQQRHAALDVQRRVDALERHAELHQRD